MAEIKEGLIEVQETDWQQKLKDSVCLTLIESIIRARKSDDQMLEDIKQAVEDRRAGNGFFGL